MLRGEMIQGRWASLVAEALPDGEVLFSSGVSDYQGRVGIVARLDDGNWLFYEWSYGSCSGCDSWEDKVGYYNEDSTGREEVKQEIRDGAAVMDAETFADYLIGCKETGASWLDPDSYGYSDHKGLSFDELMSTVVKDLRN
jgi:hypothetical protein